MKLNELEYPRHLHKNNGHAGNPNGDHLLVSSADEAEAALKDGWSVDAFAPNYDDTKAAAQAADGAEADKKAKKVKA